MFNLLLGIVTFLGAIAIFVYQAFNDDGRWYILGTRISAGWFLLLLTLYNLARWYSSRAWGSEEESLRIAMEARKRQARDREHGRGEPDPTFDFSDRPINPPPTPPESK